MRTFLSSILLIPLLLLFSCPLLSLDSLLLFTCARYPVWDAHFCARDLRSFQFMLNGLLFFLLRIGSKGRSVAIDRPLVDHQNKYPRAIGWRRSRLFTSSSSEVLDVYLNLSSFRHHHSYVCYRADIGAEVE